MLIYMIIQIGCLLNHKGNFKVYDQIKEKFISVIQVLSIQNKLFYNFEKANKLY